MKMTKLIRSGKRLLTMLSVGGVLLLSVTAPVSAQEAAAPAAPAAAGGTAEKSFMDIFHEGGIVMYFCLVMSVCVVAFTAEGFVKLRVAKLAPPVLVARLREAIEAGNYQDAWQICQDNPCFLSTVLMAGLERIGRSKDAVDFAMQESGVTEGTLLKTNTTYLSVIGVIAPMVGLSGTVVGMIKAFSTLGSSGISDPSKLAANIGEVLVATAAGLMVAIPAFVFFYILKAKAQTAILRAETVSNRLMEEIPYDQIVGIRIGEFATEVAVEEGATEEPAA